MLGGRRRTLLLWITGDVHSSGQGRNGIGAGAGKLRSTIFSWKTDLLDIVAAGTIVPAAFFVVGFFWQASAGAAGGEEAFLDRLKKESEKRMLKEREQIRFLLDGETGGMREGAWEASLAAADRLDGNSQLHLLLARGYREMEQMGPSIREYRRALEINRDYTDSRSAYYIGERLHPFVKEARAFYLEGENRAAGSGDVEATIRDLFYLERILAGGCF